MKKTLSLKTVMKTSKGEIPLSLFPDKAPLAVSNFVNLAQRGYYNNLKFHRVIEDFMIQGGCPKGTGTEGPGYSFDDEFVSDLRHDKPGILSMANSGPATNGSQFFITHVPTPWLDDHHTIFGAVDSKAGQKVVNSIKAGAKIEAIEIDGDTETLFSWTKKHLDKWNEILDDNFPRVEEQ